MLPHSYPSKERNIETYKYKVLRKVSLSRRKRTDRQSYKCASAILLFKIAYIKMITLDQVHTIPTYIMETIFKLSIVT